ncbi:MAG: hypothetical protein ACE5I7_07760 [Candidatus Binatia bacterium]
MKKAAVAVAGLLAAVVLLACPVHATFHVIVIDQVFPGLAQAPDAQYVMLKTQAPLQVVVFDQPVAIFDVSGSPLGDFARFCASRLACSLPTVSPACSAGGCPTSFESEGSRILVATPLAQGLFCVTADLIATGELPYPDGRVCFGDCDLRPDCPSGPVDCLAYGAFSGDNGIFGIPAGSVLPGAALVASPDRRNQFAQPNLLDNAAGFSSGVPLPQNFRGDVGALDGVAGDATGTGILDESAIDAEVGVLFEADGRCALAPPRRGADANFDARVNAADVVAAIQVITAVS